MKTIDILILPNTPATHNYSTPVYIHNYHTPVYIHNYHTPAYIHSYNIGQLAYLNAQKYGLQRIIFGGFFLRGHPFTMETISFAIRFWSQVGTNAL